MMLRRIAVGVVATIGLGLTAAHAQDSVDPTEMLAQYIATPDASFSWRELRSGRIGSVEYTELLLTSQTWRGIPWKHRLFVLRPKRIDPQSKQGFLYIHGGRWRQEYELGNGRLPREAPIFAALAESLHAPLAIVAQVPFQPLFERTEDALIAHTFDQYLRTGDASWPLLLPMTKSASRAMDAVQQFVKERWGMAIEKFTVSGASKRGWTSWLTAAADSRIAAVAPMVIDMLNIPEQIELQRATFGTLSDEVQDYADINLPDRVGSQAGRRLLDIVDPYSHRASLTQPKLILLGTNDRYWPLDALKVYWNDLPEPKRVLYLPNQGHSMRDFDRLIGTLSALHRYSAQGTELPSLEWRFSREGNDITVAVSGDRRPHNVLVWTASSASRDFREAEWSHRECKRQGDSFVCQRPLAPGKLTAVYAEAWFKDKGERPFSLSTTVCIAGATTDTNGC